MNRRDFNKALIAGIVTAVIGSYKQDSYAGSDIAYDSKLPENPYVPRIFGHQLTETEINQMRRLHRVTWTWEAGKWSAFPSGNYEFHNKLVPDLSKEGYKGPITYKEAGWILDDLQDMLLVDFRAYRRNITQRTLNAGLMLPCAVALHKLSRHIGTLNNLDSSYPKITLIEALEQAFDADTPRKCFRSSYQQLEAYRNTVGEDYDPATHYKYANDIAAPGRSAHGTGSGFDLPKFLQKDRKIERLARRFGFRKRLPIDDPAHLEYIGIDYVDFPRPADVARYARIYKRLEKAKIKANKRPNAKRVVEDGFELNESGLYVPANRREFVRDGLRIFISSLV